MDRSFRFFTTVEMDGYEKGICPQNTALRKAHPPSLGKQIPASLFRPSLGDPVRIGMEEK
jgi:hypothetical protein